MNGREFEVDGVLHWVEDDTLFCESGESIEGAIVGVRALVNPQPGRATMVPAEEKEPPGSRQNRYGEEIRQRAIVLWIDNASDITTEKKSLASIGGQLKKEFGLQRAPSKRLISHWVSGMVDRIHTEVVLPLTLGAQIHILEQRDDIKTLQRAVEYGQDRIMGRPVQPIHATIAKIDMSKVIAQVQSESDMDSDEGSKIPPETWT